MPHPPPPPPLLPDRYDGAQPQCYLREGSGTPGDGVTPCCHCDGATLAAVHADMHSDLLDGSVGGSSVEPLAQLQHRQFRGADLLNHFCWCSEVMRLNFGVPRFGVPIESPVKRMVALFATLTVFLRMWVGVFVCLFVLTVVEIRWLGCEVRGLLSVSNRANLLLMKLRMTSHGTGL